MPPSPGQKATLRIHSEFFPKEVTFLGLDHLVGGEGEAEIDGMMMEGVDNTQFFVPLSDVERVLEWKPAPENAPINKDNDFNL